jgi:hypothetical protein
MASCFLAAPVFAKDYKSGELISTSRFGFGAFEARLYAATGPGVISTFFLWKPGSELPSIPWEEIDFELGIRSNHLQTQIMTPGDEPPLYRMEHVTKLDLTDPPWNDYHIYRMEWTPDYIAFFIDGVEVRRETDTDEYAALFNTNSGGDTPDDERMELRLGVWPGAPNIAEWSGDFDGSSVPTALFVDYVTIWDYTPNASTPFSTVLLHDDFDSPPAQRWYGANWTFEFSASDYIPQNIGAKFGTLVVALTDEAGQGILPDPPDAPPTDDNLHIEAEDFEGYHDTTPGNSGSAQCSSTDVDAELTLDSMGGRCNIGWTTAGEWLDYSVEIEAEGTYDVVLRLASQSTRGQLHLEVDGVDVSGPVTGPGEGWQTFSDYVVYGVPLSAGIHQFRLGFDVGEINVNYFELAPSSSPQCDPMDCDDGDPCTTDTCEASGCIHRPNGSCSQDGPCSGLCTGAIPFTSGNFYSGELGSSSRCYETTAALNGGHCGNLASSRSFTVNGVRMPGGVNFPSPLPEKRNGGYCFQVGQGDYPWAFFVTW